MILVIIPIESEFLPATFEGEKLPEVTVKFHQSRQRAEIKRLLN